MVVVLVLLDLDLDLVLSWSLSWTRTRARVKSAIHGAFGYEFPRKILGCSMIFQENPRIV